MNRISVLPWGFSLWGAMNRELQTSNKKSVPYSVGRFVYCSSR
jgi:hypothetical protein